MNPLFQDLLYKPKFTKNQMGLKGVSKPQIALKIKARTDEKAQHTR